MKNKDFFCIRNVIVSFILFMCLNFLINFSPFGLSKLVEITGGHSILDMEMKGYSVDRAYEILDALGDEGREFYIKYIVPIDFPFPLAYGVFYFTSLTLIFKNIFSKLNRAWLVGLIGFCATLFDWFENFMIIILLQNYPQHNEQIAIIASICTQIKSLFTLISLLLIIVGILAIIFRRFLIKVPSKQFE